MSGAADLSITVKDLANDVDQLQETVYRGNGKPSLIARMEVQEAGLKSLTKIAWYMLASTLTLLVTVLANVLGNHLK